MAPTVASAATAIARLNEPWRSASARPAGVATMRTSWNAARTTPIAAGSSPRAASHTGKNGKIPAGGDEKRRVERSASRQREGVVNDCRIGSCH